MFGISKNYSTRRFSNCVISSSLKESVFRRHLSKSPILQSEQQPKPAENKQDDKSAPQTPPTPQQKYMPPIVLIRKEGERLLIKRDREKRMAEFYLDIKKAWKWRELNLNAERKRIAQMDEEKRQKRRAKRDQIKAIEQARLKILAEIRKERDDKILRARENKHMKRLLTLSNARKEFLDCMSEDLGLWLKSPDETIFKKYLYLPQFAHDAIQTTRVEKFAQMKARPEVKFKCRNKV